METNFALNRLLCSLGNYTFALTYASAKRVNY